MPHIRITTFTTQNISIFLLSTLYSYSNSSISYPYYQMSSLPMQSALQSPSHYFLGQYLCFPNKQNFQFALLSVSPTFIFTFTFSLLFVTVNVLVMSTFILSPLLSHSSFSSFSNACNFFSESAITFPFPKSILFLQDSLIDLSPQSIHYYSQQYLTKLTHNVYSSVFRAF